jgi:hypothetical protein
MRRSLGAIVPLATALILGACVGERDNPCLTVECTCRGAGRRRSECL